MSLAIRPRYTGAALMTPDAKVRATAHRARAQQLGPRGSAILTRQMAQAINDGASVSQVAARFDLTSNCVRGRLRRAGYVVRKRWVAEKIG